MLVTADSMKKLADDVNNNINNEKLDYILELIRLSAENGNYHITLHTISNSTKITLENFGFHVEHTKTGNAYVSWKENSNG